MLGVGLHVGVRRRRGLGEAVQFVLDQFSGAAAAFALRRLRADFSGPVIGVRREYPTITGNTMLLSDTINSVSDTSNCRIGMRINGDNIPLDSEIVSFDATSITIDGNATMLATGTEFTLGNEAMDVGLGSDDWLDETALLDFVGAGDGRVSAWYLQSTANATDLTQTTASLQPRIVTSGVVEKSGGKPAIAHDADHYLAMAGFTARTSAMTVFDVLDYSDGQSLALGTNSTSVDSAIADPGESVLTTLALNSGSPTYYADGAVVGIDGTTTRAAFASALTSAATGNFLLVHDSLDMSSGNWGFLRTRYSGGTFPAFPSRQEIIIYPQSAIDRDVVGAAIAAAYGRSYGA